MIIEGINQFSFGGRRSYDDMGLIITDPPVFTVPERDRKFISVPGRSGDIIDDNGRYKNITASYKVAAIREEFEMEAMMKKIRAWLVGNVGYSILSDTYDPAYYRLAVVNGAISLEEKMRQIGTGTIKFSCKPYKYRIDGQNIITLASSGVIYNPEEFESTPYIKIIGNGDISLQINNATFNFAGVDGYIEIDGDIMAAYKGTLLQNTKISFIDFPKLAPGANNIVLNGAVTEIQIKPRWCAI